MEEKTLLKFCLIGSLLGILALFMLVWFFAPEPQEPENIGDSKDGDSIRLTGTILKVDQTAQVARIDIGSIESTTVVVFADGRLQLQEGQKVRIDGRVQEFKGSKELIADEIMVER